MRIFDKSGTERDWAWVESRYGQGVQVREATSLPAFRLIELREREDFAGCEVRVQDECELPMSGVRVCQGWRDGPELSDLDLPLNELPPLMVNRGFVDTTDDRGRASFGWGRGEYYDPARQQEGAHYYWIGRQMSDVLAGVGMLVGTNHAHLEPLFCFVLAEEDEEEPSPPPPTLSSLLGELREAMEDALDLIEEIQAELRE